MEKVYDLIEALRVESNLSVRRLAALANIAPATLAATLSGRADKIAVKYLQALAKVFRIGKWNYLLKMPDEEAAMYKENDKVATALEPGVGENLLRAWRLEMQADIILDEAGDKNPPKQNAYTNTAEDEQFQKSILYVMKRLNSDGLMEVMRYALDLTKVPAYCLPPQENDSKEDTGCQENEQ